jgi:cellulose synthase (UDP-forming)
VSVLHGAQFSSYRVGNQVYWVGDISWMSRVTMIFQKFPWLIAIVSVILCFLIAALLQAKLRRRARVRLQAPE